MGIFLVKYNGFLKRKRIIDATDSLYIICGSNDSIKTGKELAEMIVFK
jgi:hypothetical protein